MNKRKMVKGISLLIGIVLLSICMVVGDSVFSVQASDSGGAPRTTYSVWFYVDDVLWQTKTVASGETVSPPLETPTPAFGQRFLNWTADGHGAFNFNFLITRNTRLDAMWALALHNVEFRDHDESVLASQVVVHGTSIDLRHVPTPPTRPGLKQTHWSEDKHDTQGNEIFNLEHATVERGLVLYAIWVAEPIETFQVNFFVQGEKGWEVYESESVNKGAFVENIIPKREDNKWEFSHWSLSDEGEMKPFAFESTPILGATNLYAVWKLRRFTITFFVDGESFGFVSVEWGGAMETQMPAIPVCPNGRQFSHWGIVGQGGVIKEFRPTMTIIADWNLVAVWHEEKAGGGGDGGEFPAWAIALVAVGGVLLAGGAVAWVMMVRRKRVL